VQAGRARIEEAGVRAPVLRSLLFVPGDSERKIEKARSCAADALVLDLEDSVASGRKAVARQIVSEHLKNVAGSPVPAQWVRINALSSTEALLDLASIVGGKPAGILLPKADNPSDVLRVSYYLDALEAREGLAIGSIAVLPVATETARAPLSLALYPDAALPRLYGLTWGAEDLSAALGAATNLDEDGRLSLTYRTVRSLTLLAAKASGVEAVDTVYPNYRDLDGLRRSSIASRREGFSGRFAIHPDQVDVINEAFSPSADDVAFAERVVAAFDAAPDTGTVGVDGKMLDRPHLLQAQKILAMRALFAGRTSVRSPQEIRT
jgi:citrate lyase subunit beta/citryl-CoA lyase